MKYGPAQPWAAILTICPAVAFFGLVAWSFTAVRWRLRRAPEGGLLRGAARAAMVPGIIFLSGMVISTRTHAWRDGNSIIAFATVASFLALWLVLMQGMHESVRRWYQRRRQKRRRKAADR